MPRKVLKPGSTFRLSDLDLSVTLSDKEYESRLEAALDRLREVQLAIRHADARAIVVFEGWDAAGKGGTIRLMTSVLDPRAFNVWPIAAPSATDQGKHYLYRFWDRLPARTTIGIFDRSWYGRVLVERIEGHAREAEWRRAYDEINAFEKMLIDDGVRLVKIFMHVSPDEQLRRFEKRLKDPLKSWKLTLDDLRNRSMRRAYEEAVEDMLAKTSPEAAPWHVIASEQKKLGRIQALELIAERLADGLDLKPPPVSDEIVRAVEEELRLAHLNGRKKSHGH